MNFTDKGIQQTETDEGGCAYTEGFLTSTSEQTAEGNN
jgi:hypothetical protein